MLLIWCASLNLAAQIKEEEKMTGNVYTRCEGYLHHYLPSEQEIILHISRMQTDCVCHVTSLQRAAVM